MRRFVAMLLIPALALVPAGCRKPPEGTLKVLVIGGKPELRDPSLGPLTEPQQVVLANVAQGLVAFDSSGNIVAALAERWNVSDDGLSYIFRIASTEWPDGRKVTAEQVAKLMKREVGARSKNGLKDSLGAIEDIVAMTDRVIEIQLSEPRPNLLSLLAQPQMAILRNAEGTGPFKARLAGNGPGLRLTRELVSADDETTKRDELLLDGASAADAVRSFASSQSDLVLGGTFDDLAEAQRAKLPRGALHFDPASGLFGLMPLGAGGPLDKPEIRLLLSQSIDRDALIGSLAVPGLAARATVLEPGLDGIAVLPAPAWLAMPYSERLPGLQLQANRLFPTQKPTIRVALPTGPGSDLLFRLLAQDWKALGFNVVRTAPGQDADFALVDEVAPSSSPAWFVRRFRCEMTPLCDQQADALMEAARQSPVPAQRYALLVQAGTRIDAAQLFIPLTAPVRWSLVSSRVQNFAGNRYARHTLTDLENAADGE